MKAKKSKKRVTNTSGPKVDYCRGELNEFLPAYYLIRDCIVGEQAIKGFVGSQSGLTGGAGNGGFPLTVTNIMVSRAVRYLPQPNAEDQSPSNLARYKAYVTRAVFYNVTGRTLEGMTGQIFLRDPIVALPTELELMKVDADGSGLTLDQLANRCVRHCISYGRTGILVDYPVMGDAPTTKAAIADGEIRPVFIIYNPWDIINWRMEVDGAKKRLTFVVLREFIDEDTSDGFGVEVFEQYRVLSLDDTTGEYLTETYRKLPGRGGQYSVIETNYPKDATGARMKDIPFSFIGSENNDVSPNKPPLYDLASINVAHYRNSADYEESCFMVGQPTPVISGVSEDWVDNVLKGSVALGSRTAIILPVGGKAELLQAKENSMPIEAMKAKEEQMVSIGAKLIKIQKTAKTATQQIIETTAESSPLANISKNVSSAIVWALGIAAAFVGAATGSIEYKLNKDFDLTSMTADDQNAVILQWQSGALASTEMRTVLRRAGTATLEDDDWKKEVAADIAAGIIADPVPPEIDPNAQAPNDGGTPPKAPSSAGGPQPKRIRRQPTPQGSK